MCPMKKVKINKSRMIMNWGKGLPPCIGTTIFSKLVISNLPACRLVCKTWNDLVLDYASSSKFQFITNAFLLSTTDRVPNCELTDLRIPKMHCINLDTRDVDFDLELKLIKSGSLQFDGNWDTIILSNQCNGLVFIYKCAAFTTCYGIFNPMTNEFIRVPHCDFVFDDIYSYGFGFSPTTKQYKLFRIADSIAYSENTWPFVSYTQESSTIMDVFTFGRSGTNPNPSHNQWRHLHTLPFEIDRSGGAYLNGVIYWLVKEKDEKKKYAIYALDVETEQIDLSVILQVDPGVRHGRIHKFNGTIYAIFYINWATVSKTIHVWRMQEKDSWIREFVIDDIPNYWKCLELLKTFEDGEILCMINMDFFCFYNRFTKRKKIISKNQEKFRYICQIESLNFGSLLEILEGMRG